MKNKYKKALKELEDLKRIQEEARKIKLALDREDIKEKIKKLRETYKHKEL